eukprot:5398007-Lingulodinium_polyedra.AAC.1
MGRTPPPGFRSGVSFESASASAANSGTWPAATRKSTSWKAASAPGEASTTRQCSKRAPPAAAPLPFGLHRSAFFESLRENGAGTAAAGFGRA